MLGNYECDEACNVTECGFDSGHCAECSPGCPANAFGNGVCDRECFSEACGFDGGLVLGGDCAFVVGRGWTAQCPSACSTSVIENGLCDDE